MSAPVFLLATNNSGKLAEMRPIFASLGLECVSMREAGVSSDPEETGVTFEENALIKARAAMEASGMPSVADDSGLMVDALGGAPGVMSARFAGGHDVSDAEMCAYLLAKMADKEQRSARFVSCIACVFPDGGEVTAHGTCEGSIIRAPRGESGFGYDPVFVPEGYDETFSELGPDIKNGISHRARALLAFKEELARYLGR
jgi:XTP/dITP diphosphohydrolase